MLKGRYFNTALRLKRKLVFKYLSCKSQAYLLKRLNFKPFLKGRQLACDLSHKTQLSMRNKHKLELG